MKDLLHQSYSLAYILNMQELTQMITFSTRRAVLRTLLSASVGRILPASKHDGSAGRERHDWEPVRNRILQAIAQGGPRE